MKEYIKIPIKGASFILLSLGLLFLITISSGAGGLNLSSAINITSINLSATSYRIHGGSVDYTNVSDPQPLICFNISHHNYTLLNATIYIDNVKSGTNYSATVGVETCIQANATLSDGLKQVYVNVTDQWKQNSSSTWNFGVDTTSTHMTILIPIPQQNLTQNYVELNLSVEDMGAICQQETANISTTCGGLSTGNYTIEHPTNWTNPKNVFDGDWGTTGFSSYEFQSTSAEQYIYINYTKPTWATGARLLVKDGQTVTLGANNKENSSIHSNCFSQPTIWIRIGALYWSNTTSSTNWKCWSGSSWTIVENNAMGTQRKTYEEQIWWNMSGQEVDTCWWSIDSWATNNTFDCTNVSVTGLSEGANTILIGRNDTMGNENTTDSIIVNVDDAPPSLTFESPTPTNDSVISGNNIINVSVANTPSNVDNLTISIYNSSGLVYQWNYSIGASSGFRNVTWNTSNDTYVDGTYYVNASCFDAANNYNRSPTRTFTIDNTAPSVTLLSPANNTVYTETIGYQQVALMYNFSEVGTSGAVNCTLYLSDIINDTSTLLSENTNYNFSFNFTDVYRSWFVSCVDNTSNSANSSKWFFRVIHEGGGVGGLPGGGGNGIPTTSTTTTTVPDILIITTTTTIERPFVIGDLVSAEGLEEIDWKDVQKQVTGLFSILFFPLVAIIALLFTVEHYRKRKLRKDKYY